jgi:DNA-binding CsgD family transcriptional regulator
MAIQALKLAREPVTLEPGTSAYLIRQMVDQVLAERPAGEDTRSNALLPSEEIIVDIDLDDGRYLLMRIPKAEKPRVQLSPREQEIVRMVAKGHSNKVIADLLSISTWTVCTHIRRIFAKLGVASRAAMVAQLIANGSSPAHAKSVTSTR